MKLNEIHSASKVFGGLVDKLHGSFGLVDYLSMTYEGNMLTSVCDSASRYSYASATDFDGVTGQAYPLTYNGSGSLVSDAGRGIARIDYDLLNNPVRIQFTNGNVTKYVYSAAGEKLRVTHLTAVPNITVAIGSVRELAPSEILSTDSTDYLLGGSLIRKDGMIDKYLFQGGYAKASMTNPTTYNFSFYYYNQDHLGNNREVVNSAGVVKQVTNYYPFGTPYTESSAVQNASLQPYKYNGKELDKMHGLNTYDYGARQYNPVTARWDRVDPLCEKYYNVSPYVYCGNNPVMLVDPDGRTVKADSLSQMNIINTVTPEEAEYIQFDENGVINVDLINKCSSTSENFLSIKQLALSENNLYVFKITDTDDEGTIFYDETSYGRDFYRGVTEMPGAMKNPSPDKNVYILIGSCLSLEQQAMTTAHEAYGHGYLYDITGSVEIASHAYVSKGRMEWDEEYKMDVPVLFREDTNITLANRINIVVNQAKNNYERRIK